MYTIEIYYNGEWHVHDTADHYADAARSAKVLRESVGDDPSLLITIEPHD